MSKHHKDSHHSGGTTASLHQQLQDEEGSMEQDPELLTKPTYDELYAKWEEADEKATQNWERLLRLQAETDNSLRRAERDVTSAHKFALEKCVLELLPIIDNMERSLDVSTSDENDTAVMEGVKLTLKMFSTALEKFGVEQINPQGEQFNPELHQAVSVQPDTKVKPNTVMSVLQKGYTLNGRLIRAALVVVSKAAP